MSSFLDEFVRRAIECINKWEYPYQYWAPTIMAVIIQKVQGKEPANYYKRKKSLTESKCKGLST